MPLWCNIVVKCSAGLWDLAFWYLRQVEFNSLSSTIYNEAEEDHFIYKYARRDFPADKNIVALHFKRVDVDANLIPMTAEELSLCECGIHNPPGLLRLTNLTRFTNDGCRGFNDNLLPWVQRVTATIDTVPPDFHCDLLEEITITKPLIEGFNLRDFQCPHLQRVIFVDSNDVGVVHINDVFTCFQLSQLRVSKATHIVTPPTSLNYQKSKFSTFSIIIGLQKTSRCLLI
ncbi:hypothetical protein DIURU_001848 [Diutina rugosa]|uniref:F-box domain-containing protein n=1 Tax=Diutina rugosa TaxID=5481 RepID=A0A642UT87_DIURU|nr:uncharacterized protein DIURU_001848 [Diutina rugosa]KAA8904772.1 hypothetical protein DIURU_001848 [Diutina rugosa]